MRGVDVDEGDEIIDGCFCTFTNHVACYNTTKFKHKEVVNRITLGLRFWKGWASGEKSWSGCQG